jgi:hypothetical protein
VVCVADATAKIASRSITANAGKRVDERARIDPFPVLCANDDVRAKAGPCRRAWKNHGCDRPVDAALPASQISRAAVTFRQWPVERQFGDLTRPAAGRTFAPIRAALFRKRYSERRDRRSQSRS